MNFDATTFGLEVLNFLVLVWLLKRFLYQPVLEVIERRRTDDEKTVAAAQTLRDEAQALKRQYEDKLAHAAEDRQRALARLDDELAAERGRRLEAVAQEVDAERQRRQGLETREREQRDALVQRQAITLGARFATRLLERLADPMLEDRLLRLTLDEMAALSPQRRSELQASLAEPGVPVQVASAFALTPAQRQALADALAALAGHALAPEFAEDAALRAGLRIRAGAWVLMANLGDELAFFAAELDHGG